MDKEEQKPVNLIVGAGITGLTAADCLARAGKKCLLVEAEDEVGGLCKTYWIDGIPFDFGPHVFFSDPDYNVETYTMELLKDEKILSRPYQFAIYAENRYWKFPLNVLEMIRYPWKYKKEILALLIKQRKPNHDEDESLEDFISNKSGRSYYANLFKSLIYKKTLLQGDRLHRDWWLRVERTVNNEPEPFAPPLQSGRILERIMRKLKPWYNYPAEGYKKIPNLLWQRYQKAGGETILNCGPVTLQREGDIILTATVKGRTVPVENVIWTGSVNTLNELIGFKGPALPYVDMMIACLTFNRSTRQKRPFIYTYHPQEDIIFNRIYYPENIFDQNLPADREGLCMELNITESIRKMSEKEVIEQILAGIEKLGLYKKEAFRECRIFLLKEGLPVYGLDYKVLLAEACAEIRRIRNLYAIGRMGGHFFCLSPSAVNQGLKIAKHLLA